MGQTINLSSYIKTRMRGSESVPYVLTHSLSARLGRSMKSSSAPRQLPMPRTGFESCLHRASDSCGRQTVGDPLSRVTAEDLVRGGTPSVGISSFRPP